MGELIRAAIRTLDAAHRAFEAMADAADEANRAHQVATACNMASIEERKAAIEGHNAYVAAERAREAAWIGGSVSGTVVEIHGASKEAEKFVIEPFFEAGPFPGVGTSVVTDIGPTNLSIDEGEK